MRARRVIEMAVPKTPSSSAPNQDAALEKVRQTGYAGDAKRAKVIEDTAQVAVETYLNSNSYYDLGVGFGPWFEDEFFQHPALMAVYDQACAERPGDDDRAERVYDRLVRLVKRRAREILATKRSSR